MAMHVPKAPGFMSMLKDGARYFEGLEEAVFRNIEACLALSKTTRSTFGPAGQNKIVINHIGRQFITNDAATILRELEVAHPAAKILVMASQQQEQEAGDGTNFVFQLAGALLEQARDLLRMGLSVAQVTEGYEMARTKALEILDELVVSSLSDLRDHESVKKVVKTSIMSKQIELAEFLSELITKACISILPQKTHFNVDNVRVLKILHMQAIADSGVKVVVSGGKVGELALHYANKMGIMIVRLSSKFDIRRLCQATGATALPRLEAPTPEELGHVTHVRTDEIADANVVIFEQDVHEGSVVTILVRGSTENIMDDVERAIDDGVNTFKCLTRSPKLLAGAGATEVELARRLLTYADTLTGLEQYAAREFARSFEVTVKALAENAGEKATEIMAMLYAKHEAGQAHCGLVTKPGGEVEINDAVKFSILDIHMVKRWAIRFATDAACTVLRVDQIIMARPAGGPKPRQPGAPDED
ncbi:hypothetical protein AHF37_00054 [Paragonimus kellicotti]|nr:hypothetical protein AHF37_00054 [Paragonimus kellicotti]